MNNGSRRGTCLSNLSFDGTFRFPKEDSGSFHPSHSSATFNSELLCEEGRAVVEESGSVVTRVPSHVVQRGPELPLPPENEEKLRFTHAQSFLVGGETRQRDHHGELIATKNKKGNTCSAEGVEEDPLQTKNHHSPGCPSSTVVIPDALEKVHTSTAPLERLAGVPDAIQGTTATLEESETPSDENTTRISLPHMPSPTITGPYISSLLTGNSSNPFFAASSRAGTPLPSASLLAPVSPSQTQAPTPTAPSLSTTRLSPVSTLLGSGRQHTHVSFDLTSADEELVHRVINTAVANRRVSVSTNAGSSINSITLRFPSFAEEEAGVVGVVGVSGASGVFSLHGGLIGTTTTTAAANALLRGSSCRVTNGSGPVNVNVVSPVAPCDETALLLEGHNSHNEESHIGVCGGDGSSHCPCPCTRDHVRSFDTSPSTAARATVPGIVVIPFPPQEDVIPMHVTTTEGFASMNLSDTSTHHGLGGSSCHSWHMNVVGNTRRGSSLLFVDSASADRNSWMSSTVTEVLQQQQLPQPTGILQGNTMVSVLSTNLLSSNSGKRSSTLKPFQMGSVSSNGSSANDNASHTMDQQTMRSDLRFSSYHTCLEDDNGGQDVLLHRNNTLNSISSPSNQSESCVDTATMKPSMITVRPSANSRWQGFSIAGVESLSTTISGSSLLGTHSQVLISRQKTAVGTRFCVPTGEEASVSQRGGGSSILNSTNSFSVRLQGSSGDYSNNSASASSSVRPQTHHTGMHESNSNHTNRSSVSKVASISVHLPCDYLNTMPYQELTDS